MTRKVVSGIGFLPRWSRGCRDVRATFRCQPALDGRLPVERHAGIRIFAVEPTRISDVQIGWTEREPSARQQRLPEPIDDRLRLLTREVDQYVATEDQIEGR